MTDSKPPDAPWSRTLRAIEGGRERIPTIPAGRATAPTVPIPDNLVTLVRMSLVALFGEGANIHAFRRDDGRIEVSATLGPVEAEALVAAAEWARGEK